MLPLVSFLVLLCIIISFGVALVFITSKIGPKLTNDQSPKQDPYECGLQSAGPQEKSRISVNFYLTAVLFVLFDIEVIFLYPWAVVYKDFIADGLGLYAFIGMAVFLTIFMVGLFWEIKSRALNWD